VCCLEGFPGVGKREIRRHLTDRLNTKGIPTAVVPVPETSTSQFDDLLLDLAQQLFDVGEEVLAGMIEDGADSSYVIATFASALKRPILVVFEDFHQGLGKETGEPTKPFLRLLRTLENQAGLQGRVLLLTDRSLSPGPWSARFQLAQVGGLETEEGVGLLSALLKEQAREEEVTPDRRADVVKWVGGNPQALRSVVAALRYEPLDALIEFNVEAWELRDQAISEALLTDLERQLLAHVLTRLEVADHDLLSDLSVYRKPFVADGMQRFLPGEPEGKKIRDRLVDNFLLRHQQGWYRLEKVAREIAAGVLKKSPQRLQRAHSIAADHYARHFHARKIVGGGRRGGDFVEARFHLVQAGRSAELIEIVGAFERHIKTEIQSVSTVPSDRQELDERISVLSALLGEEGAKGLELHLAKCLESRGQGADQERALIHARRAIGPAAPSEAWIVAGRLAAAVEGNDSAITVFRKALSFLSVSEATPINKAFADILIRDNRPQEAIDVLREGIAKVPPESSLSVLYVSCAALLACEKRTVEAIELLQEGIAKFSPKFNVSFLYRNCAGLLAREEKTGEAIELLQEGIAKLPLEANVSFLYVSCAELLTREGRTEEAIELLREGIAKISSEFGVSFLYVSCAELLNREKRTGEAIELLRKGIARTPPEHGAFGLYQSCADLLARNNRTREAIELLLTGIPVGRTAGSAGNYKLAENLLYIAAAASETDLILRLVTGEIPPTLGPEQRILGTVFISLAAGEWVRAAEQAREGRNQRPTYLPLCAQEAFCWLSAQRPLEAQSALDRFPREIAHGKRVPMTWLASFIALRSGRREVARDLYSTYIGDDEQVPDELTERHLLRQWNSTIPLSVPHPAFYWPILPASLTGLDHVVRRSPPWPSCPEIEVLTGEVAGLAAAPAEPEIHVRQPPKPELQFLVMATEWRSRHGGVSSFNRALCSALAQAGFPVACVVPSFDAKEKDEARKAGIELIPAPAQAGGDELSGMLGRLELPDGFLPNVVIGHGRITGFAAKAQIGAYQDALRIHFIHLAPGEIEFYKGKADAAGLAEKREQIEVELAKDAGLVVAIGPRLEREVGNYLAPFQPGPKVYRIDPPVERSGLRTPPPGMQCLLMGRAEDFELKGLDIAALAMGKAIAGFVSDYQPELVVRGAPKGTGADLRARLMKIAKSDLPIRVREYTDQATAIESDIQRSSVLLMPSRREGFGLVASEAAGYGTPILVSDKSGIGELLKEVLVAREAQNFVVNTPNDVEQAAKAWAKSIEFVLRDLKAAFGRAMGLSRTLADSNSWESTVEGLVEAIQEARRVQSRTAAVK
jgi:tetratricopeptide (TPR) repeat protein/glycosyltransferase involved in cell wall biosynthesis